MARSRPFSQSDQMHFCDLLATGAKPSTLVVPRSSCSARAQPCHCRMRQVTATFAGNTAVNRQAGRQSLARAAARQAMPIRRWTGQPLPVRHPGGYCQRRSRYRTGTSRAPRPLRFLPAIRSRCDVLAPTEQRHVANAAAAFVFSLVSGVSGSVPTGSTSGYLLQTNGTGSGSDMEQVLATNKATGLSREPGRTRRANGSAFSTSGRLEMARSHPAVPGLTRARRLSVPPPPPVAWLFRPATTGLRPIC